VRIANSQSYDSAYIDSLKRELAKERIILDSLIQNTPVNENIRNYHKNVYKAEFLIMKEKYAKAAKTYEKAFSFIEYPYARDLRNALNCEKYSKDRNNINIEKYIYLLIRKNEKKDRFLNDTILQKLSNWEDIKNMIDTTLPAIDKKLVDYLEQIYYDDQNVRVRLNAQRDSISRDSLYKEMAVVDSTNYHKLIAVFEEYPNLSEELIGISGFNSSISTIFIHHRNNRIFGLIPLYHIVTSGKVSPNTYAEFLGNSLYQDKIGGGIYDCITSVLTLTIDDVVMIRKYTAATKKEVNNRREKLYLESIDDCIKKRIWQSFRKNNVFLFYKKYINMADEAAFYKDIKEKKYVDDIPCEIYYRNKDDKKRIQKAMKEYYKNKL
jgi:hypothetical protein